MEHLVGAFPGRSILINEASHLYFGGTSYLGLQTDKHFKENYIKNVQIYGTNYGASRNANIKIDIFHKAEAFLAELVDSENCVSLSSGYLAGQLIASALNEEGNGLFYAPHTHAALQHTSGKAFDSYAALNIAIKAHLKNYNNTPVVFLDTIDMSRNNYPHFSELKKLPLNEIILVADDSHGIGIIGENGGGVFRELKKLHSKELIVCCSLGKGFGIQAGAIFGTKKRIQDCKKSELFGGASPATPSGLATLIDSQDIFIKQRKILQENTRAFIKTLKNTSLLECIENYPAFYFQDAALVKHLEQNNILITNFNYPTKNDTMVSRIVISAAHLSKDIQHLATVLNAFK